MYGLAGAVPKQLFTSLLHPPPPTLLEEAPAAAAVCAVWRMMVIQGGNMSGTWMTVMCQTAHADIWNSGPRPCPSAIKLCYQLAQSSLHKPPS